MKITHVAWMLALAIVGSAPVAAADLSKINRTIAKEPAYQSKPKYCLLVFGLEAKTRVWLGAPEHSKVPGGYHPRRAQLTLSARVGSLRFLHSFGFSAIFAKSGLVRG